jgi:NAD(P)-dependent dehydrogenase (short-subunit alcohol dehydrogenase family)
MATVPPICCQRKGKTFMSGGRVQGKVAMVTGGGSGIGRATAALLAKEGGIAIVADFDLPAAEATSKEIIKGGGNALPMRLDVSNEADWQNAIETALATYGRLDVLVNNAGVSFAKPADAMTLAEWRTVMAVNIDGVFLRTKWAISAMKKGTGGSIINVASLSGIKPAGGASAYCASKAAVRMFSKTVAIECADANSGIRVNLVSPSGVKTPMWEKMAFFQDLIAQHGGVEEAYAAMAGKVPSQQFFTSHDVALTILFLASDESRHLTGTEIVMEWVVQR